MVAHWLQAGRDGLEQMAEVLVRHDGLDAVHIVRHGAPGRLELGTVERNSNNSRGTRIQKRPTGSG